MSYWHEVDAKRQAERDFERRHRPNSDMYDRYGSGSQRAYVEEFDRCRHEDERRREARREEERIAERREQQRIERRREKQWPSDEAEADAEAGQLEPNNV